METRDEVSVATECPSCHMRWTTQLNYDPMRDTMVLRMCHDDQYVRFEVAAGANRDSGGRALGMAVERCTERLSRATRCLEYDEGVEWGPRVSAAAC